MTHLKAALLILLPQYSDNDSIHILMKIIILVYILISVYCSDKSEFSDLFEPTSYTFLVPSPHNFHALKYPPNQIFHYLMLY